MQETIYIKVPANEPPPIEGVENDYQSETVFVFDNRGNYGAAHYDHADNQWVSDRGNILKVDYYLKEQPAPSLPRWVKASERLPDISEDNSEWVSVKWRDTFFKAVGGDEYQRGCGFRYRSNKSWITKPPHEDVEQGFAKAGHRITNVRINN